MPNVADALKSEISRIARKELRPELNSLKKGQTASRSDIAALKRLTHTLTQAIRILGKHVQKTSAVTPSAEEQSNKSRFSPKSLASQRRRLGLSAEDCGVLIGASGQSVYNWEAGKARPRASHLAAIAALKTLGRRSAAGHVAAVREARSGAP